MPAAVCPTCQRRVHLPDNATSRTVKTMCPQCGELLSVPPTPARHPEDDTLDALHHGAARRGIDLRGQLAEVTASSRNLGLFVLALGLVSLLSLAVSCLTFMVYVGLALSGIGALLGLYGMLRGLLRRDRNVFYVLAGVAACTVALVLIETRLTMPPGQTSGTPRDPSTLIEQRKKELTP